MLPELVGHLLHGERPPKAPETVRLRDLVELPPSAGGWVLLGERPSEEIALGLVGKFWRPVIEYELAARPLEEGTLLSGLMRTATTDEHARRWFRRYWFGVGSGAHTLVHALLESVRERAEQPSHQR
jgi:hypothetical protein